MAYIAGFPRPLPGMGGPPDIPEYLKTAGGSSSTIPQGFGSYASDFQTAYGGVPMGVDQSRLAKLFEDTLAAGMERARRGSNRATGSAGGAAGRGGYTAEALRRTAGEQSGKLAEILSAALGQEVQNTLGARAGIAQGRTGPTTQSQWTSQPREGQRLGSEIGGQVGQSFGSGGGGGRNAGQGGSSQDNSWWNDPSRSGVTPTWGSGGGGGAPSGSLVSWGMPSGGIGGAYDQYRAGERADYTAGGGISGAYDAGSEAGPPEYNDVQSASTPEAWWQTKRGQEFKAKGWTPNDWSFLDSQYANERR